MSSRRLKISISEATGLVWPKISGRGSSPPTILAVRKLDECTRLYGIRILA